MTNPSYEQGFIRTDRGLFYDKGNQVFDVRHQDFGNGGARGDGVTDDALAFQQCDDAADGGTCYAPQGTFVIGSDITLAETWEFAEGAVIQPASGVTVTMSGTHTGAVDGVFDESQGGTVTDNGGSRTVAELDEFVFPWTKDGVRRRVAGLVAPQEFDALAGTVGHDSTAALEAAQQKATEITNGSFGAAVLLPTGVYEVSRQITLKDRVRWLGMSNRGAIIRAQAGFSDSYMFLADDGGTSMFGSIFENLDIDCNNVAGLGAVVSDAWQENCGFRRCLVRNWRTHALHVRNGFGGAASLLLQGLEAFASPSGAVSGVRCDQISLAGGFLLRIADSTITGVGAAQLPICVDMANDSLLMDSVHFEFADIGVQLDGVGRSDLTGVSGSSSGPVVDVVRVKSTFAGRLSMNGVQKFSSTNLIVNEVSGETITDDIAQYSYPYTQAPNQAKVWATFDGATGALLSSSAGITSVTRHAAGDYQINFKNGFPDVNYAYFVHHIATNTRLALVRESFKSATSVRFQTSEWTGASASAAAQVDPARVHIVAFAEGLSRTP